MKLPGIHPVLAVVMTAVYLILLPGAGFCQAKHKVSPDQLKLSARSAPQSRTQGQAYGQFRSSYGVIRWISDQMPLKVYVSHGKTLVGIIDEDMGAPACNIDNLARWPDVVANLLSDPEGVSKLPVAEGFNQSQYEAVIAGISMWKPFEKEGLFSFQLVDDPAEADIYVFFVHHFVNKMGLALFANDIRGYTAKRSFPLKAVLAGQAVDFKPVLIQIRTTDQQGAPLSYDKMRAAAAHEFGHALGIEGHSTNPNDLMSVYYGSGTISANDAATIRYLYHLTPDLIP
jgi:predicted Zn-dependent protease